MNALSPLSMATLGIGFGAVQAAYLGLWPFAQTPPAPDRTTAARYLPWIRRKPRGLAEPFEETEALLLCGAI